MKPLKSLAILLGLGLAGGASAAPSQPPPVPALAEAAEVDFEIRLGIPGLERHDDRTDRRLITPRRAVRIANARVPMRVRSVDRTGRAFVVHGMTRRGPVSVSVHRFTGKIIDVDFGHDRRARRHRGISAGRAADIATARLPMRVNAIAPRGRVYEVRGFSRAHGPVTVKVDRFTGRIEDVDYARGPHGSRFGHRDRDADHLERRRGGLDIIVRNSDDDDDRRRGDERRRENPRDVGP
ncbi:hypothetical protein [Minwuia thermotolerans]|uniref:PepSY domain-containing protein n=1 Tax=Minwuia thermotolerans TaxID=2056226 RepID=A0A2M9FVM5_9PROT|nr:hypothetical protein [Minwuia thermotolerans]PJK27522.1 hypothetical protein CVT23_21640 [Minwuia thermotolerans]